ETHRYGLLPDPTAGRDRGGTYGGIVDGTARAPMRLVARPGAKSPLGPISPITEFGCAIPSPTYRRWRQDAASRNRLPGPIRRCLPGPARATLRRRCAIPGPAFDRRPPR